MKNLLVDALRQASGTEKPAAEEPALDNVEKAPAKDTTAPLQDSGVDARELKLIESTVLPKSAAPQVEDEIVETEVVGPDDPDVEPNDAIVAESTADRPDRAARNVDPEVVDPTLIMPSLGQAARSPAESSSGGALVKSGRGQAPPGRNRLITVARWSPALCLVTLSAAAGSLALYQKLTARNLNFDLTALPSPSGTDAVDASGTPTWLAVAETHGSDTVSPGATSTSGSADQAHARTQPKNSAEPARDDSPKASLARAKSAPVDDPLFGDVERAYDAYAEGRMSDAESLYRQILQADANYRHALTGLAAVLQRTSRNGESVAIYERLIAIDPNDTAAAASLAAHAGDAMEGETRIKLLLQRKPEVPAFHFALGLLMANENRWPEAYESFTAASELTPTSADFSYNVAVSAQRLGYFVTARSFYSHALANVNDSSLIDRQAILNQLDQLPDGEGESS